MAGEAVIKIGADTTEITSKLERVGDKVKSAGDKASAGISKAIESLTGITPKLMGIAGALAAINAAASIANSVATAQAQGNRTAGARNMAISEAALRAGVSPTQAQAWANTQEKSTSPEGKLNTLLAAGAENDRRAQAGMPPMSAANVQQMMSAYDTGGNTMFGPDGQRIASILSQPGAAYNFGAAAQRTIGMQTGMRGASLGQMAAKQFQSLPESTQNELVTKYIEGQTAAATQEQGEAQGTAARRGEAYRRQLEVINPYSAKALGLLDNLPLFEAASRDTFERKAAREYNALQRDMLNELQRGNAGPPLPNTSARGLNDRGANQ